MQIGASAHALHVLSGLRIATVVCLQRAVHALANAVEHDAAKRLFGECASAARVLQLQESRLLSSSLTAQPPHKLRQHATGQFLESKPETLPRCSPLARVEASPAPADTQLWPCARHASRN